MGETYKRFLKLKESGRQNKDVFHVDKVPTVKDHMIGISASGSPIFFVKCAEQAEAIIGKDLAFISVQFNEKYVLKLEGKKAKEGTYTVILLKENGLEFYEYFTEIVFLMLKRMPLKPTFQEIKREVITLADLFHQLTRPPLKAIQGLWAELLVIDQSPDPDYLVRSWHVSTTDKFDFNDGSDKLEVKSTVQTERKHTFSLEQLHPNSGSKLLIASVFTTETGMGASIFDLMESIKEKLRDQELAFTIAQVVTATLGREFLMAKEVYFDYENAKDSLAFYNADAISRIELASIPSLVTNVKFTSDLTKLKPLKRKGASRPLFLAALPTD